MKLLIAICLLLSSTIHYVNAQSNLANELDRFLITQFKPDEAGGVVLVAKNGTILYKKAFGLADLELNVPVNDSMIFYIGSNTKQFTAVAILQLVERNKLQLQDTLGKFISAAPYPISSITLTELLSHTSGITEKNDSIIKKILAGKSINNSEANEIVPGQKWEYSNVGYEVLGFIIEKITGGSYADYIFKNIFAPAGMAHSYVDETRSIIKNRAHGYSRTKKERMNSMPAGKMGAAGGILSTVEDMLRWVQALERNLLLKKETLQLAHTPQKLRTGAVTGYGLGWYLQKIHGSANYRHGGRTAGYTAETLYFPQEAVYVIMLTNTENPVFPVMAVARIIAGMAINKPYILNEQPIDQKKLKAYTGLYENEHCEQLYITEEEGKLIFQRPEGNKHKLGFAGNDEFLLNGVFFRVNFNKNAVGRITSLKLSNVDMMPVVWVKLK